MILLLNVQCSASLRCLSRLRRVPSLIFFLPKIDQRWRIPSFTCYSAASIMVWDKWLLLSLGNLMRRACQVRIWSLSLSPLQLLLDAGGEISVSTLDVPRSSIIQSNVSGNELNLQANLRVYLLGFLVDLPVTNWNSIQIQSSSLLELTEETNQLIQCSTNLLTILSLSS